MTRWAGVSAEDRRAERREMLVRAGYRLFGAEADLTVRAVCREAQLHTRYFYENFADVGGLLGAVYDGQASALGDALQRAVASAGSGAEARTRAGVRGVLEFLRDDPRRGRLLFSSEVLASRRRVTETELLEGLIAMSGTPSTPVLVAATMFTGAMAELARQWADGRLGDDLDTVVDTAVTLATAMRTATTPAPAPIT
ncbi:TetR/AcrR family transcriptional regulator [Cryptosporangium arvum]|uniref:Transcriptional regulator, TetR family n=1 Tax=Cryptosporangium arvum DSM 44712 TaxID=927661 RepID=A0A011A0K0_9ACTN|nr:TetR/AcrR family transcriptional regulator [Cryptosporangium arvum]EXG83022.1 transcriptional regulator, TetR family [Cryptosporangium arvum DSM 44712]